MLERTWTVALMASALALAAGCRDKKERTLEAARPDGSEGPTASASAPGAANASPRPVELDSNGQLPLGTIAEQQKLLQKGAFEVTEHEGQNQYLVPPHLRVALVSLKDLLLSAADRNVDELVKAPPTEKPLERMFVKEGATWASEKSEDGAIDGTFVPAPQHKARWLLTLCIRVSPGNDCLAAVYERRGGPIRRAMVFRNDDYTSIEGAVHALEWVISPPDGSDRFYLLEAHTYPWPASNWRDFSYSALMPSPRGGAEPVAQDAGSAYWVDGFDLKAQVDGFTVGYSAHDDDVAKFKKTVVHRWKRTAVGFERIHDKPPAKARAK